MTAPEPRTDLDIRLDAAVRDGYISAEERTVLAARVAAPSDGLREALSTPPPEWLDEYSGAKGWEEAMLLVEAALATTGQPETIR